MSMTVLLCTGLGWIHHCPSVLGKVYMCMMEQRVTCVFGHLSVPSQIKLCVNLEKGNAFAWLSQCSRNCHPKWRFELIVGTPGHSAGEQTFARVSLSLHLSSGGTHMICILKHSFNQKNARVKFHESELDLFLEYLPYSTTNCFFDLT